MSADFQNNKQPSNIPKKSAGLAWRRIIRARIIINQPARTRVEKRTRRFFFAKIKVLAETPPRPHQGLFSRINSHL